MRDEIRHRQTAGRSNQFVKRFGLIYQCLVNKMAAIEFHAKDHGNCQLIFVLLIHKFLEVASSN